MTTPITRRHGSRMLPRLLVLVLLTMAAGVGLAGPAAAHNVLISSDPSEGAVVQTPPTVITLTFDEAVQDFQPVVTVLGPDGQKYESGAPQVDSTVVTTPVAPLPTAGDYVIAYRVVSADGHPVQGEVHFRFAAAAPSTSSSAPTSSSSTGSSPTSSPGSSTSSASVTSSTATAALTTAGSTTAEATTAAPSFAARTTASVAPASSSSGLSGWAWAAIVVVAALIVAAAVVIIRRRGSSTAGSGGS
ncbi:copper resistance CopC family protein [Nakamurella sp. GG22]